MPAVPLARYGVVVMDLGTLFLVGLAMMALVLGPILLLNARDRRREALLQTMGSLTARELWPMIAIEVDVSPMTWRARVAVDMRDGTRDEIWAALARWHDGLPPGVRLLVKCVDAGRKVNLTVETSSRSVRPLSYRCCATAAGPASRASSARLRSTPQR